MVVQSLTLYIFQFLNQCLLKWHKLKHDNVARLLGISMAFGPHPALITSWMTNGKGESPPNQCYNSH